MEMAAIAIFAAIYLLSCALADNASTTLLLPNGLFDTYPITPEAFYGQVTVAGSTTYYTFACDSGPDAFYPGEDGCNKENSYIFSASSSSTQYILPNYSVPYGFQEDPTLPSVEVFPQTWTINCGPLFSSKFASCLYTYLYNDENTGDPSTISPTYVTSLYTAVDSSLYPVSFTSSASIGPSSSPAAGPAAAPINPTASSTSTGTASNFTFAPYPSPVPTAADGLGLSSKIGIGLGAPLGACALAGVALLVYRHGKHKERSRLSQMGKLAPPGGLAVESDAKELPEAGAGDQMLGRQPPVYSLEMPG